MIVYLHGFNSSPHSHKAQVLGKYMVERGLATQYVCPALPPLGRDVIALVESLIARKPGEGICFVGSSLGGFYATYLAEKHAARAVLINPAIDPHIGLRSYLGKQKNLTRLINEEMKELGEPAFDPYKVRQDLLAPAKGQK